MPATAPTLPWLQAGDPFPPVDSAWGPRDPAPGLLAAGGELDARTLEQAYRQGIFPWFSAGQPILWWSPDPRMVLVPDAFRLHRSLRRTIAAFAADPRCTVRVDSAFADVVAACADTPREGQAGTWIVPAMQTAYRQLHQRGLAHSVETWVGGELVGGLYCVAIGGAVFGESMFSRRSDASKIALAALVALCRDHGVPQIDCQQNTRHLASLGAAERPRSQFVATLAEAALLPALPWATAELNWDTLLRSRPEAPP